ncbi:MAG: hypothetical protein R3C61_21645 [Bacteroidia bacterium]
MRQPMVILALYNQIQKANQHASLLKAEGVRCVIDFSEPIYNETEMGSISGGIQLLVHRDDFERADLILEMDDRTSTDTPADNRPGEQSMLAGGVIGMAGILSSFANLDGLPENMIFFPFAVVAMGGILFWKGMMDSREEN